MKPWWETWALPPVNPAFPGVYRCMCIDCIEFSVTDSDSVCLCGVFLCQRNPPVPELHWEPRQLSVWSSDWCLAASAHQKHAARNRLWQKLPQGHRLTRPPVKATLSAVFHSIHSFVYSVAGSWPVRHDYYNNVKKVFKEQRERPLLSVYIGTVRHYNCKHKLLV